MGRNSAVVSETILALEHEANVAARLSAELAGAGFRVLRATNSASAIACYVRQPKTMLLVNGDHPSESAWLLIAKLRLTHPAARIWVYLRQPSAFDLAAADYFRIEALIEYGGSVPRLTAALRERLALAMVR